MTRGGDGVEGGPGEGGIYSWFLKLQYAFDPLRLTLGCGMGNSNGVISYPNVKRPQIHLEIWLSNRCCTTTKIHKEEIRLLDETTKEKNI